MNESFHFKNIKELNINCIPKNNDNNHKYFYNEFIKGDITWENLEKLKLSIPLNEIGEINLEEFKSKEIGHFLKYGRLRNVYDDSDFFEYFLSLYLKTKI